MVTAQRRLRAIPRWAIDQFQLDHLAHFLDSTKLEWSWDKQRTARKCTRICALQERPIKKMEGGDCLRTIMDHNHS